MKGWKHKCGKGMETKGSMFLRLTCIFFDNDANTTDFQSGVDAFSMGLHLATCHGDSKSSRPYLETLQYAYCDTYSRQKLSWFAS